jgi:hypothetical protein
MSPIFVFGIRGKNDLVKSVHKGFSEGVKFLLSNFDNSFGIIFGFDCSMLSMFYD